MSTRRTTPSERCECARRLAAQCLSRPASSVASVARRMLGLQAQDLHQARWALAVRSAQPTRAAVDAAFAAGEVVRTWSLRGTLHLLPPEDLPWLVRLLAPRNLARAAGRLRELAIGERDVASARAIVERVLTRGTLSRDELFAHFEAAGQAVSEQRGVHLLFCLSQAGVLCQAGEAFALADAWIAHRRDLEGDEALGELAKRYVEGHGSVAVEDLAFWAGIGKREAKRAFEIAGQVAAVDAQVPRALLLPGYDEYLLGYAERSFCIDARHAALVVPGGNGVYLPMVVLDGRVRATWRRVSAKGRDSICVRPFEPLSARGRAALAQAVSSYGAYAGSVFELQIET